MSSKRNPNAPFWIAIAHKEREIVEGALRATGGNVSRSASALGIHRTYLIVVMKRLDISRESYLPSKVSS